MFRKLRTVLFGARFSDKTAKNRLQMVLVQDRSGLSSVEMENFRKDLMEVIGRYFILEKHAIDIEWQRSEACVALLINTPVMGRSKSDEEIRASARSDSASRTGLRSELKGETVSAGAESEHSCAGICVDRNNAAEIGKRASVEGASVEGASLGDTVTEGTGDDISRTLASQITVSTVLASNSSLADGSDNTGSDNSGSVKPFTETPEVQGVNDDRHVKGSDESSNESSEENLMKPQLLLS